MYAIRSYYDDGKGFDSDKALHPRDVQRTPWGLLGIQERVALVGGVCFIISEPGDGTTIHATVPIINKGEIE